jgi:hypothetical protein
MCRSGVYSAVCVNRILQIGSGGAWQRIIRGAVNKVQRPSRSFERSGYNHGADCALSRRLIGCPL